MKAKIDQNGNFDIQECTPEELVKTMELLGKLPETKIVYYPVYPSTVPYYTYGTKVTCDSGYITVASATNNISGTTFTNADAAPVTYTVHWNPNDFNHIRQ